MSKTDRANMSTSDRIARVCDDIKAMLISKNISYGDSALDPVRVFSTSHPYEQLLVRIDDKLSRIQRGSLEGFDESYEDAVKDLVGYMILLLVARRWPPNDAAHRA